MTLAESLQKQFRADLRFRGAGYLDADRVSQLALTPDKLIAAVQEKAGEFTCDLDRSGGSLRMSCTCPSAGKLGVCKHLWGAVLLADRDKLLSGPVRGAEVPPFNAEEHNHAFDTAWDFSDEEDDDFTPARGYAGNGKAGGTATETTRTAASPPSPPRPRPTNPSAIGKRPSPASPRRSPPPAKGPAPSGRSSTSSTCPPPNANGGSSCRSPSASAGPAASGVS